MFDYFSSRMRKIIGGIVFVDITEFLNNPVRAGVQRTMVNVLANWPSQTILPFHLRDDGKIGVLAPDIVQEIVEIFSDDSRAIADYIRLSNEDASDSHQLRLQAARMRLRQYTVNPLMLLGSDAFLQMQPVLLNVEVFNHPPRVQFYERAVKQLPENVFFLIYDFMPFLQPEVDPELDFSLQPHFMGYVHLVRQIVHVSFISQRARREYVDRICHGGDVDGPVFALGADGLGPRGTVDLPRENHFVVLGAIEPRKQQLLVQRVFRRLCAENPSIRVTFVGKLVRLRPEDEREFLLHVSDTGPIRWVSNIADAELADLIRSARATIFASGIEGYALPPLESLSLGVPTITLPGLPSLAESPPGGRIVIDEIESDLEAAVRRFTQNRFAAEKRREIQELVLPTWSGFAGALCEWVTTAVPRSPSAAGEEADGDLVAKLQNLRRVLRTVRSLETACRTDVEDAIIQFHRQVLGQPPTGEQWQAWYGLARRTTPTSANLCLAMLGHYRDLLDGALHSDLLAVALSPEQNFLSWLSSNGLARPRAVAALLRRIALAASLPAPWQVPGLCGVLGLRSLPADGGAESFAAALRRTADSRFVRDSLGSDTIDAEIFFTTIDEFVKILELCDAGSNELIDHAFQALLKRPPADIDIEHYSGHLSQIGSADFVVEVACSDEARQKGQTDKAMTLIAIVENMKKVAVPIDLDLKTVLDICSIDDANWVAEGIRWFAPDFAAELQAADELSVPARFELAMSLLNHRNVKYYPQNVFSRRKIAEVVILGGLAGAFDDPDVVSALCKKLDEAPPTHGAAEIKQQLVAGILDRPVDDASLRLHAAAAIEEGLRKWPDHVLQLGRFALRICDQKSRRHGDGVSGIELSDFAPAGANPSVLERFLGIVDLVTQPRKDVEFAAAAYRVILRREPDDVGLDAYCAVLAAGLPQRTMVLQFLESDEYRAKRDPFGAIFLRLAVRAVDELTNAGVTDAPSQDKADIPGLTA